MIKNNFIISFGFKSLKTLIGVSLIVTFASCNLEPEIYDRIAPNNFFQTVNDLKAATTSVYWELRTNGWSPYLCSDGSSFIMNEVATGEWTSRWSWEAFLNLDWIIGEKMVYGFYPSMMTAISRATYVVEKIKDSPLSDDIKAPYIAEIRALRAYWAFDLYRFYGCLPITVDRDVALYPKTDYRPSRPSKEWMLNFIESELRAAANDLPKQQSEYGRCTKGMALTKLLKFYMHEKEWSKAEGLTQEIMTLGYDLMDNYADIFKVENEQNKEIIFAVVCEPRDGFGLLWFANTL
ncbi:MAG: RagB/SusD family nutrient uptake outer membrane protein, partial [Candidatus Symbiothrix sp.]|nr:RagB/SusD family nutrient uptake outer membrane protein [Candidatus Symbiothrix sp.]